MNPGSEVSRDENIFNGLVRLIFIPATILTGIAIFDWMNLETDSIKMENTPTTSRPATYSPQQNKNPETISDYSGRELY